MPSSAGLSSFLKPHKCPSKQSLVFCLKYNLNFQPLYFLIYFAIYSRAQAGLKNAF